MKVVVGLEDELYGNAIIDFIGSQKWAPGTEFELVHALELQPVFEEVGDLCCLEAENVLRQRTSAAQKLLMDLDLRLLKLVPDAQTEQKLVFGGAKVKLLDEVEHLKAELLIVGSHGRKGFSRFLLGSVSTALLSHAPCSVLIVKIPTETGSEDSHELTGAVTKKQGAGVGAVNVL